MASLLRTIAVLFSLPPLFAQARLTLTDAVPEALSAHPQLAAAAARVGVAEGLQRQAGLTYNPRLVIQTENTPLSPTAAANYPLNADIYAFIAQTIETGGKRSARAALAAENVRRSQIEVEVERRQVAGRASTAYWAAAGAAQARDLLQPEVASFDRVVQVSRDRVREGAAPEVDLLRIEVERQRLEGAARTAAQDADRTRIALFREMGKTEFPSIVFADPLDGQHPVEPLAIDQALERRPEMKLAREGVEQARAALRSQHAAASVDPDVQLGYKRSSGFDMLYGAIQIPLPVRNRNQGQIEAAAADIHAAEAALAAAEALIRSELASARSAYELRQRLLQDTLRPMRDRADEVYQIASAAYRETGGDLLRLLDSERTKIDADLLYARALSNSSRAPPPCRRRRGICHEDREHRLRITRALFMSVPEHGRVGARPTGTIRGGRHSSR